MGQALYRKYRPTSFDEAVGHEHITQTLKKAIKSGNISHAYLFTGPRGIGKTSLARILAHEVNGIPYTDDSIHLDIIEIDAASNRRIDEIRELRDKVHISPTSAKYKVYIIDEVHMLTREAFNALLKTLEEPPEHCIFILATTEVHKLPDTIISRVQRFSLSPISTLVAVKYLKDIAKKENIKVSDGALELIASHAMGSFRDNISLLDQLNSVGGEITEDTVRDMLGLPDESAIKELLFAIADGDSGKLLRDLEGLRSHGTNAGAVAKEIGSQVRADLISGDSALWRVTLLRELIEISSSSHPEESLEIALLSAAADNKTVRPVDSPKVNAEHTKLRTAKKAETTKSPEPKEKVKPAEITTKEIRKEIAYTDFDIATWPEVVEYAKKHAASLYTALRLAKPVVSGDTLTLYFQFPLHQKKLNQAEQKDIIGQIIEEVCGAKIQLKCEVNKELFSKKEEIKNEAISEVVPEDTEVKEAPLNSISNIFGKAEVLEST